MLWYEVRQINTYVIWMVRDEVLSIILCTHVGLITFVAVGPYKYMLFHIACNHLTMDQLSFCPSELFPQW